ncbi:hypothetical protein [Streptomyces peucetius]|uniref:Transposase n=1 Tax=Streptomyces peucetius TaxID=1950 RepID=A0ABY6I1K5_STRPE|nr:hypothetical protein [Streptomyces peucetius]UYQ60654.1 hypothetical protein OGH68_03675 [Streptomyces peucetius]
MDALTGIGRCQQQLATACGRAQTRTAANALEAARQAHLDRSRRKQNAKAKLRRACTAARTANRELAALYAPHAGGRAVKSPGLAGDDAQAFRVLQA